ncbi:unnamed protein product [Chrysoparadoxa australica]
MPDSPVEGTSSKDEDLEWSDVAFTIALYLTVALFFQVVWQVLRTREWCDGIYRTRSTPQYARQFLRCRKTPAPPYPSYPFQWGIQSMMMDDGAFFDHVGLDGYLVIRFCRLCAKICLFSAVFGMLVLTPLWASGNQGKTGPTSWTMANLPDNSLKQWAAVVFAYVYTFHVMRTMRDEYERLAALRADFLASGDPGVVQQAGHTVLVEGLPVQCRSAEVLKQFMEAMFPNQVHSASVAMELGDLGRLINLRHSYVMKLEQLYHQRDLNRKEPKVWVRKGRPRSDTLAESGSDVERQDVEPLESSETAEAGCFSWCSKDEWEEVSAIDHYVNKLYNLNVKVRGIMQDRRDEDSRMAAMTDDSLFEETFGETEQASGPPDALSRAPSSFKRDSAAIKTSFRQSISEAIPRRTSEVMLSPLVEVPEALQGEEHLLRDLAIMSSVTRLTTEAQLKQQQTQARVTNAVRRMTLHSPASSFNLGHSRHSQGNLPQSLSPGPLRTPTTGPKGSPPPSNEALQGSHSKGRVRSHTVSPHSLGTLDEVTEAPSPLPWRPNRNSSSSSRDRMLSDKSASESKETSPSKVQSKGVENRTANRKQLDDKLDSLRSIDEVGKGNQSSVESQTKSSTVTSVNGFGTADRGINREVSGMTQDSGMMPSTGISRQTTGLYDLTGHTSKMHRRKAPIPMPVLPDPFDGRDQFGSGLNVARLSLSRIIVYFLSGFFEGADTLLEIFQFIIWGSTSPVGIVTFRTKEATAVALQCQLTERPAVFVVAEAPEPEDLIWRNITRSPQQINHRRFAINMLLTVGALFWSLVIGGIQQARQLLIENPTIESWTDDNSALYSLFYNVFPSLMLLIAVALLGPIFLNIAAFYEGYKCQSTVQLHTLPRLFWYQVANVYVLITTVSIASVIDQIFQDPYTIWDALGKEIPRVSVYCMAIIIAKLAIGLFGVELLKPHLFIFYTIRTLLNTKARRTPRRERVGVYQAAYCPHAIIYSGGLLVLIITMVYQIIAPFVTLAGLLYFWVAELVYKYNLLHLYLPQFQSGGSMMGRLFWMVCVAVVASQLSLIGFLVIKGDGGWYKFPFLAPLPFIVAFFGHKVLTIQLASL